MAAARTFCAVAGGLALGLAAMAPARAAVINTFTNQTLSSIPFVASFGGGVGTLSFTSSVEVGVGPGAAVSTDGNALVNTVFGGPTDYQIGTVFDGTAQFTTVPTATLIPDSATDALLGFSYTGNDGVHYGYAEVYGSTLIGYAYQSVAGASITGASLVPEPASVVLVLGGLAGISLIRRRRDPA